MSGVNKAIIVGRLGADPESKTLEGGQTVTNMSVATSEKWTDKDGNKQEKTEWTRVTCWGKTAENCAKYLKKGSQAYIEGKLQTRSWDDDQGNKKYMTEVVAQTVQFLDSKSSGESKQTESNEEIPF